MLVLLSYASPHRMIVSIVVTRCQFLGLWILVVLTFFVTDNDGGIWERSLRIALPQEHILVPSSTFKMLDLENCVDRMRENFVNSFFVESSSNPGEENCSSQNKQEVIQL